MGRIDDLLPWNWKATHQNLTHVPEMDAYL